MTGRNILSRELAESIRQCLGRKVKLSLKVIVRAEVKSDKFENRVLGFSTCRLFVLTLKIPTRVDQHFHYLDIQGIESRKPNQLCLTVCDRTYSFYTNNEDPSSSHEVDTMILSLGTALKNIFPSIPIKHIIRKVDVQPPKRIQPLEDLERVTLGGTRDMGPCGGFSDQYACMCDYHALPYRAEVAWDVDTIYLSHDTRELYLHDFDYLEQKDLIPIISALEYNTWFCKFRASHSKLSHEAIERILHVISKSLSIEELYLDNIGAKAEFANKLSLALLSNSNIPLQKLDISHNPIEDKGAVHISNPIGRQAKGLSHLNLASCGLTSKGVNMLAHSLSVNKYMCQTLTFLSLAGNSLKDEVNNLYNFLAQPNFLKTLDLSATECAIDAVFGALLRGCTSNLSHLNLSRNGFGNKKTKEMFPSFKQYFTSTIALANLNLSHCKLPADALKNVLLGLACNENITEVSLDLSNNHLGATGAQILESCIHGVRCLVSLDISENSLENQLGPVVLAISKNKSIKSLNIGKNLNSIKSKHVNQVMEAVVHMLQEEECVLETLIFNDSRLKLDLHSLLNALGSNRCLQRLDISGNYMGDSGARLLAKALQINSKLQYISYDRNNITLLGYSDIAYALQSNYVMKFMPFPVHDVTLCMKTAPERTENIMRKIQDSLCRNISPRKYSNGQAFRLQQGFLLSSTQQQVDRLVLQTGEIARTLKRTVSSSPDKDTSSNVNSLLQWSDALISDAENSKQLITHFHDVLRRDDAGNPIEAKLHQISKDLHTVIKNYVQDTVESMVRSAQDKCPNVLGDEKVVDEIRSVCLAKSHVSTQFLDEAIVEQAGSVILNKVNEVNLSIASAVSDRVIDEVVDSLSKTCKSLQTGEGPRKRAMTGVESDIRVDRGSSDSGKSERSDAISQGDTTSQKSDPSPLATPQLASKRKSLHGRKLRPQSVVDTATLVESLGDDARVQQDYRFSPLPLTGDSIEEPSETSNPASEVVDDVSSAKDSFELFSEGEVEMIVAKITKEMSFLDEHLDSQMEEKECLESSESLDSVSELPSSCGQLQHLGKGRPRRVKTRAPTRPMGRAQVLEEDHDISQGVDNFFRPGSSTPTTPLVSPDSENSPRLTKYGSTSSMESFPNTGGARTGSERGSMESLTRSESDVVRESPRLKNNRSEDDDDDEEDKVEENGDERRSVSSLIGKLGGETALKLSPDLGSKRLSSHPSEGSKDEDENSQRKSGAGFHKIGGRGMGVNLLAEMKARQEKRSSFFGKEEESKRDSKEEVKDDDNQSSGLLGGVKLRSTGLANNLKSPTNGFSRSKSPVNRNSNPSHDAETADSSPSSNNSNCKPKPQIKGLKPKAPPPLLGPKPRPKSAFSLEHRAASDEVEDDDDGLTSHKSVRELAASLASKGVTSPNSLSNINNNNNFPAVDESEKKKSSSLPRTPAAVPAAGGLDSLSPSPPVHPFVEIPQEEEIVSLQKDETTTPIELPTALYRQTSQKHVLSPQSAMTIDDVVDV
ncbi:UNVERIFIED_CONTAM: hypothetical protein RMT77_012864 [Armadillidium vulgare]